MLAWKTKVGKVGFWITIGNYIIPKQTTNVMLLLGINFFPNIEKHFYKHKVC
jgi:hypothetical protein